MSTHHPKAVEPQDASDVTKRFNSRVPLPPPGTDTEQTLAQAGLLYRFPPNFEIPNPNPLLPPIWSLAQYAFLTGAAPDTVNPSLWRNALLNMNCGLFQVVEDAVYQVRGADLSNISFIEDPAGSGDIVVLDPLVSEECAAVALQTYLNVRAKTKPRKIIAVIFSHSHVDHYGGVRGLFPGGQIPDDVAIVAPDGFLEHVVSENVYAGTAMTRRASFMYGLELHKSARGEVDAGLGKTSSTGTVGFVTPTVTITETTDPAAPVRIKSFLFEFQLTPGTEAPSEMNFFLPQTGILCMAENATPTLHNIYSLRGTQVRDAKAWSEYLHDAIQRYGSRTTAMFASHFWPRWKTGQNNEIVDFLTSQADLYRYLHDQTLRLANQGHTMTEIAEMIDGHLPAGLSGPWYNHGYYGTTSHNVKSVYQRYLGWFDGNAAHLHGLTPSEAGRRYVLAMGGAAKVVENAQIAYDKAETVEDYRWLAELLSHVTFADPEDTKAKQLEANVLEQLGYQSESGPWRNFYASAAQELRDRPVGLPPVRTTLNNGDVLAAMSLEMLFDFMGIRLSGALAAKHPMSFGLNVYDGLAGDPVMCTVRVRNGVLVYLGEPAPDDVYTEYRISRAGLNQLAVSGATVKQLEAEGSLTVLTGDYGPLTLLAEVLLEYFDLGFAITMP